STTPFAWLAGNAPDATTRIMRSGGDGVPNRRRLQAFLVRHNAAVHFSFATTSMIEASAHIVRTGEAVMAVGGYTGFTPAISRPELERRVRAGEIRYVLLHAGQDGRQPGPVDDLRSWVRSTGREVPAEMWRPSLPSSTDPIDQRRAAYVKGLQLFDLGTD